MADLGVAPQGVAAQAKAGGGAIKLPCSPTAARAAGVARRGAPKILHI